MGRKPLASAPSSYGLLRLALPGLVAFLLVQSILTFGFWFNGFGGFSGPDPYMRLARVLECKGGFTCSGGLFPRSNVPFGEVLHWPFFLDRLILALSAPFQFVTDFKTSVVVAGYLIGPLLGLVTFLALTASARHLLKTRRLGGCPWWPQSSLDDLCFCSGSPRSPWPSGLGFCGGSPRPARPL